MRSQKQIDRDRQVVALNRACRSSRKMSKFVADSMVLFLSDKLEVAPGVDDRERLYYCGLQANAKRSLNLSEAEARDLQLRVALGIRAGHLVHLRDSEARSTPRNYEKGNSGLPAAERR